MKNWSRYNIPCSYCGAEIGKPCKGRRWLRTAVHHERYRAEPVTKVSEEKKNEIGNSPSVVDTTAS